MQFDNSIYPQPTFSMHRRGVVANDPAISAANLAALMAGTGVTGAQPDHGMRRSANAKGYNSLHGYVSLTAGTVTIQPLLATQWRDPVTKAKTYKFSVLGSAIAGLADGDSFEIQNVHGGKVFCHVAGLTGAVDIFLAGGERAPEGSI